MELTKQIAKKILKEAQILNVKDFKEQKLFDQLFEFIAPSSYAPMLEDTRVYSFLSGVEISYPGITEDIEYYLYEACDSEMETVLCEKDGKKYNAKNADEYAQFIVDIRK